MVPHGVINVTCYSGRQFVSVASHVCDEGYQPNVTSSVRVCRDNGLWSGTTIAYDFVGRWYMYLWCVSSCSSIHIDVVCRL